LVGLTLEGAAIARPLEKKQETNLPAFNAAMVKA